MRAKHFFVFKQQQNVDLRVGASKMHLRLTVLCVHLVLQFILMGKRKSWLHCSNCLPDDL